MTPTSMRVLNMAREEFLHGIAECDAQIALNITERDTRLASAQRTILQEQLADVNADMAEAISDNDTADLGLNPDKEKLNG